MTSELDVADADREDVFEAIDALAEGESLVLRGEDAAVIAHQYQFTYEKRLDIYALDGEDAPAVSVASTGAVPDDEYLDFDVRDMPPQRRHSVLLETFDLLEPGQGFVLVNDHDPAPLYHELQSTRGDVVAWEDLEEDPSAWRTQIVKTDEVNVVGTDVDARFDVREIPKAERHGTIHHRYGNLADGEVLEIIAPHRPEHLREEFVERYGDAYTWEVVESDPGRCRVRIRKGASDDGDAGPDLDVTETLDVRDRPPAQRHEAIYDAYADLQPGEGFVLVNDHDPKPLKHQFDAEAGPGFRWHYRQQEPGEFRVLIGKAADATEEGGTVGSPSEPDAPF